MSIVDQVLPDGTTEIPESGMALFAERSILAAIMTTRAGDKLDFIMFDDSSGMLVKREKDGTGSVLKVESVIITTRDGFYGEFLDSADPSSIESVN